MSVDAKTIEVYDARAAEYARQNKDLEGRNGLLGFCEALPKGAHVLDLGCGPGHYAAFFANRGCLVDAVDASLEMVTLADQHAGVSARHASFDDISGTALYDGIWANFSLLHAPRADFPKHLATLHRACKPDAMFHIGMKLGSNAARDTIDRMYTYYTEDDLLTHLMTADFKIDHCEYGNSPGLDGVLADWITVAAHA
ncbi:MAG: SAM-dependent methyltransferase [Marinosulfonomonas sp.]|nr:MAG: SAM-dependent methyltransferase [Marinosulfonomonas sp.]